MFNCTTSERDAKIWAKLDDWQLVISEFGPAYVMIRDGGFSSIRRMDPFPNYTREQFRRINKRK